MRSVIVIVALFLAASLTFAQQPTAHAKPTAEFTKLEKAYKESKATFAKKPKDAGVKKKYVSATVAFGTATMMSASLPPKDKYSGALRLYREALKFDPKNKEALENKKMIEDIYKSMGRPIPK